MNVQRFNLSLGDKEFIFETGNFAQQCNASVYARYGDSTVLATCAMSRVTRAGVDYLPLMVNYIEKYYAGGVIGGIKFQRREGRPTENEVLVSRFIDRGLRPMINKYVREDIQVMATVLSYDFINPVDIVAANAASFAVSMSECPMYAPLGTVRVGRINGEFVLNPSVEAMGKSDLDLVLSCSTERIVMIEASANEIPEEEMYEALLFGEKWGKKMAQFIAEVQQKIGKPKKEILAPTYDEDLKKRLDQEYGTKIEEIMFADITKLERFAKILDIVLEAKKNIEAETKDEEKVDQVKDIIDQIVKQKVRHHILESGRRIKNRGLTEFRTIRCEIDVIPRAHGVALFERGETQGLTITTLGAPGDQLLQEGMHGENKKRYFHHYNFPPFSVGETSHKLWPGNREIGHGNLAEKALMPVFPSKEEFPYTVRTVTEILQSNGSSSMAATCGSTLSLMAAGVPIKTPVSGIAMGLMSDEEKGIYKILSDLQDEEDFGGDMDFKIAGTKQGITAIQLDIKIKGLPDDVIKNTLQQAKEGRLAILDKMLAAIGAPRQELSPYAPRLLIIKIDPSQIRDVIGRGGEIINGIIEETGVEIDIEKDGNIIIVSKDAAMAHKAVDIIKKLTQKLEVGQIFEGTVVRTAEFGAFVEILPGKDGLVHISCLKQERVIKTEDVVHVGDTVKVKLIEIDNQGRLRLSMKDV